LVGRCYLQSIPSLPESAELYEAANKEHYAELWIGDHVYGPAEIIVTDDPQLTHLVGDPEFMKHYHHKDIELSTLFKHKPEKFLGQAYVDHFSKINPKLRTQMAFLFKLLAVNMALSI
jgi:mannose-6-phosphate isomerase class I